jgi:hypothetical protein
MGLSFQEQKALNVMWHNLVVLHCQLQEYLVNLKALILITLAIRAYGAPLLEDTQNSSMLFTMLFNHTRA